jgi:hypothetical protein
MNPLFNTVVLAACMALFAPGAGASVSSLQQGMHQWPALKGRLILINGTYQDILKYKRSLTFYFESKPGEDWLHVPVITSDTDQDLTWFSISQGEQTVADAVVVAVAGGVELVVAETRPGHSTAAVTVRWYRLTESDDDHPDGPAYFFRKISSTSYPASAKLTVEQVLKKEVAAKSKK